LKDYAKKCGKSVGFCHFLWHVCLTNRGMNTLCSFAFNARKFTYAGILQLLLLFGVCDWWLG
jgi:hypothetical protein